MLHLVIDLPAPTRMARVHVLLRLLVAAVLGSASYSIGWPGGFVYLAVPAISAVLISQHRAERFLDRDARLLTKVYGWFMAFHAYMGLLTDQFPLDGDERPVRYEGEPRAAPSVGGALLRIVTSLLLVVVLCFIGMLSAIVWVISAISILFVGRYPRPLFDFQCGVLKLQGQALVYHASLVDEYPRISLDLGPTPRAAAA